MLCCEGKVTGRLHCLTNLITLLTCVGHGHVGAQPVGRVELSGPGHVPGDGVLHSSGSFVHPGEVAPQRVRKLLTPDWQSIARGVLSSTQNH